MAGLFTAKSISMRQLLIKINEVEEKIETYPQQHIRPFSFVNSSSSKYTMT